MSGRRSAKKTGRSSGGLYRNKTGKVRIYDGAANQRDSVPAFLPNNRRPSARPGTGSGASGSNHRGVHNPNRIFTAGRRSRGGRRDGHPANGFISIPETRTG